MNKRFALATSRSIAAIAVLAAVALMAAAPTLEIATREAAGRSTASDSMSPTSFGRKPVPKGGPEAARCSAMCRDA